LALGLFGLTFVTTTSFGTVFLFWIRTDAILAIDSAFGGPREMLLSVIRIPLEVWTRPELRRTGLSFSVPLLTILLAHELGHFFACRRHGIPCTLPYFLPAPILIGTAGAFIRIRARIRTRSQLFDVGAAGPIAGFVVLLPFLVYGLANSPVVRVVVVDETLGGLGLLVPGQSLVTRLLIYLLHGPLDPGMVLNYHPCALAAWVGLLVTSLNLIPVGQLDGGHILYAASPVWYRRLRPVVLASLALLGFLWPGWWLWFGVLLIVAWRHPPVLFPAAGLDPGRRRVGLATLVVFLAVFLPVPLSELSILL
jgi:membrane-associated protease RseP (regulator of RpoE activity)